MAVIKYCSYSLYLSRLFDTIQKNYPIDREKNTLYTLFKIRENIKYVYICKNK